MVTRKGSFLGRGRRFLNYGFILFVGLVFAQAQSHVALRDWKREKKKINNKAALFLCTIKRAIIKKTMAFPCQ